jgi:proline iminopeptidase
MSESIWSSAGRAVPKGDLEGLVRVNGVDLFYEIYGRDGKKGTVLCLHGGPGGTLEDFQPLIELSTHGYRVVLYNQMGSHRSQLPRNKSLLTVEHYVEEVEALRVALDLGKINIVGQSWGGMLAMAYALKYQSNMKCMVTNGGPASVPLCLSEMTRRKLELPVEVQKTLQKYEEESDYQNPEYLRATEVYYRNFLCRLPHWPEELLYAIQHLSKLVYQTMWGPTEFVCIGALRYWDITRDLHEIRLPTLVTCGRYDEVSPVVCKSAHDEIRDSKFHIFEKSAHESMWDETANYLSVVTPFLDRYNR